MRHKREKDYWVKKSEKCADADGAQSRAASLRMHDHTSHVQVRPAAEGYDVSYSVARWYLGELKLAGIWL